MAFLTENSFGGKEAVQDANNYPHIRLFTTKKTTATAPLPDLEPVEELWAVANNVSISMNSKSVALDDNWLYFSATAWFTAKALFDARPTVPLGLVESAWGGTRVEFWSTPASQAACNLPPMYNATAYNAMIAPLATSLAVSSFVWWQGEANSGQEAYACLFPSMIAAWRQAWVAGVGAPPDIPFGFVQLNSVVGNGVGFAVVRWAQALTQADPRVPNTWMAVAYDLGDPTSPYGSVHSRHKVQVGQRMALGALDVVYDTPTNWTGPQLAATCVATDKSAAVLHFTAVGSGLNVNASAAMWEACTAGVCPLGSASNWTAATVSASTMHTVTLALPPSATQSLTSPVSSAPLQVRYAWADFPCDYMKAAVYAEDLPLGPFVTSVTQTC